MKATQKEELLDVIADTTDAVVLHRAAQEAHKWLQEQLATQPATELDACVSAFPMGKATVTDPTNVGRVAVALIAATLAAHNRTIAPGQRVTSYEKLRAVASVLSAKFQADW
jgi:hypothetical protein